MAFDVAGRPYIGRAFVPRRLTRQFASRLLNVRLLSLGVNYPDAVWRGTDAFGSCWVSIVYNLRGKKCEGS